MGRMTVTGSTKLCMTNGLQEWIYINVLSVGARYRKMEDANICNVGFVGITGVGVVDYHKIIGFIIF